MNVSLTLLPTVLMQPFAKKKKSFCFRLVPLGAGSSKVRPEGGYPADDVTTLWYNRGKGNLLRAYHYNVVDFAHSGRLNFELGPRQSVLGGKPKKHSACSLSVLGRKKTLI